MKRTHEYKNNFLEEYQKAKQFLEKGCKCGCSATLPRGKFAERRAGFQNLSKLEKDAFMMANLTILDWSPKADALVDTLSFHHKERTNLRTFYLFEYKKPICQETYINMLGISRDYLEDMRRHLLSKGISSRVHGNKGRSPQ
jgi:hypothetical protein